MFGPKEKPQPRPIDDPQTWPPPEIAPLGPRETRLRPGTHVAIHSLRAVSAVAAILGSYWVVDNTNQLVALRDRGVDPGAKVTSKRILSGKSKTYEVSYDFKVNGFLGWGTTSVSKTQYEELTEGAPITITVLPDNFAVRRTGVVDETRVRHANSSGLTATIVITLILFGSALAVREYARAQQRELADWPAFTAQVTLVHHLSSGKSGKTYLVSYQYVRETSVKDGAEEVTTSGDPPFKAGDHTTVLISPRGVPKLIRNYTMAEVAEA